MKAFLPVATLTGVLFLFPFPGSAEPELKTTLEPLRHVQVGQTCQLHIQLKWRTGEGNYLFAQPQLELENLVVEENGEANETFQKDGEEWKNKVFVYKLKATQAGKGKVRPFRIIYTNAQVGKMDHLEVEALEIRILPDHSIFFRILLVVLGSTTVLGAAGGWFWVNHARQKNKKMPLSEPSLEERYLSNLTPASNQLLEAGKVFRSYLTEKFLLSHGGSTHLEILDQLEKKVRPDEMRILKKIFGRLDEHRFGNPSASQAEHQELYREMVRFVEGKKIV